MARKFREVKDAQSSASNNGVDISVADYSRIRSLQQLPATYPFWTRHATTSGIVYMDFDPTVAQVVDGVDVDISEYKFNLSKTPLMLAWFRFADSSNNYSSTTDIYKYPLVRRNSSGTALESFTCFINSSRKLLRFSRRAITAYGTGTTRVYIKFFIFDDDPFKNPNNRTGGWFNP
jgi:hypothetical protein